MLLLVSWGRRSQNFPGTVMTRRTDHSRGFHGIHQVRRAVVADLEFSLYGGNRYPPVFGDKGYGLIKQRVAFVATTPFAKGWHTWQVLTFGTIEHIIHVFGFAPGFPGADHPVYFIIINKGTVYPYRQSRTWRQVQHVPVTQQLLSATLIKHGA